MRELAAWALFFAAALAAAVKGDALAAILLVAAMQVSISGRHA